MSSDNHELTVKEEVKMSFTESKDEFGNSFCCDKCGKNQFYVDRPEKCDHNPGLFEISMKKDKDDRNGK